jgi:hypothetical protein
VTYSWTAPSGTVHKIGFILAQGAGDASYLGATEVPVSLALEWIDAKGQWPETLTAHQRMLDDFVAEDPRRGPRTFKVRLPASGSPGRFELDTSSWLPGAFTRYPASDRPAPPTANSPLNYFSAEGATLFTKSLHCRLPFASEWTSALEARAAGQPNLRDARWNLQLEHQKTQKDQYWPDADIFLPADRPTGLKVYTDAVAVTTDDDGLLWFADAQSGGVANRYHHLLGNVAEFVAGEDGAVFVIGGSALAPPELEPTRSYPVDLGDATLGFSDVGLRLAFTVGKLSGSLETQRILNAIPLLRE